MEEEYKTLSLQKEGYDLVIMNPFYGLEKTPAEKEGKLRQLYGEIVSEDLGYWSHFFAAADNVIKPSKRLAAVTPEEFFAAEGARKLREWILLKRSYFPRIVVKSAAEVAFSEGTLYRDYLVNFEKPMDSNSMILAVIKKIHNVKSYIERFRNNLKPLIAFYIYAERIRTPQKTGWGAYEYAKAGRCCLIVLL